MTPPIRAAYVHVPFCAHRCGYCNFAIAAGRADLIDPYLRALAKELEQLRTPRPVQTLYFGGGTPTQLTAAQLRRLLRLVLTWHPVAADGELTVEANPTDLDDTKMQVLADHGVTRISLGVQSFDKAKLEFLERDHRDAQIRRAYAAARRHVESVALDLIFGVPGETHTAWAADLSRAVALGPDHVSTYSLTIEKGSPLFGRALRGLFQLPDERVQRWLFEQAIDTLTGAGYDHYEVSSFARPGRRCRHNEVYWLGESYFAAGPGAARYVDGCREVNHRSTSTYLRRVLAGDSPVAYRERLAPEDRARELLVLALRRLEGIDRSWLTARTGFRLDDLVGSELARYVGFGLLEDDGRRVRLTREGLFVSDSIWGDFLRV